MNNQIQNIKYKIQNDEKYDLIGDNEFNKLLNNYINIYKYPSHNEIKNKENFKNDTYQIFDSLHYYFNIAIQDEEFKKEYQENQNDSDFKQEYEDFVKLINDLNIIKSKVFDLDLSLSIIDDDEFNNSWNYVIQYLQIKLQDVNELNNSMQDLKYSLDLLVDTLGG